MKNKKLLGYAPVDSGQLILIDPCYLSDWKDGEYKPEKKATNDYARACEITQNENAGGEMLVSGIGGTGVVFSSGMGDGNYPVIAHYEESEKFGRRIKSIEIKFF